MSEDPWADLRTARDDALSRAQGPTFADEYERGAISMVFADITGEPFGQPFDATLRVELRGMDRVDAYAAGSVAKAVQQAAAILARHQLDPTKAIDRVSRGDRQRALLIQEAQNGNVVWFRVPSAPPADLPIGSGERAAQRAVRELLEYLPQNEDDDAAVDGILGAAQPVRKAVDEVAAAASSSLQGLGLRLSIDGVPPVDSLLTRERAVALHETLSEKTVRVEREQHVAKVDGLRNSRRVLYLILDDKRELAVSLEEGQLRGVLALVNRRVLASLESRQVVRPNGSTGRPAYRLLDLSEDPALFQE